MNDQRIRQLLDDLAGEARPDPAAEAPTLRRARRRRAGNVAVAAVLTLTLATAAFAVVRSELPAPSPPRPAETPDGGSIAARGPFPGIWPEATRRELLRSQDVVDAGRDRWRTDAARVAGEFAATFLTEADAIVGAATAEGASGTAVDIANPFVADELEAAGLDPATRLSLEQLGQGGAGIWTVTGASGGIIALDAPSPAGRSIPGGAVEVSGRLAYAPGGTRVEVGLVDGPLQPAGDRSPSLRRAPVPVSGGFDLSVAVPANRDGVLTLFVRAIGTDGAPMAITAFPLRVAPRAAEPTPSPTPSTSVSPPAALRPIEVERPVPGASVTSPVAIVGTADVFEATVSIQVRDETNAVIARDFTTATCGSGCRGDFRAEVPFVVDHEQPGTIVLYEANAASEGPGRLFLVRIPVTLIPAESPAADAPIVVDRPAQGDAVASPVTISGTADVFEATVSIRILDEAGSVIADDFTTASCGSGCRGTYRATVRFRVDHRQPGTIQVFESSAENGEPLHMVQIPVTLRPRAG